MLILQACKFMKFELNKWYRMIPQKGWVQLPDNAPPLMGDFRPSSQAVVDTANEIEEELEAARRRIEDSQDYHS